MFAVPFLVLAMLAFSSAFPARTKGATSCVTPSTFTITQFSIFTPLVGNPYTSNLFFIFEDEKYRTQCNSNITSNPTTPVTCADSSIQYLWDGNNTLTIGETCTQYNATLTGLNIGSLFISLNCIPFELPFADGTLCEDLVGELTGEFTRGAWKS